MNTLKTKYKQCRWYSNNEEWPSQQSRPMDGDEIVHES